MFFLEKFASVDSLMIKNELPTVHEFHVKELFKFIVASLSTGHPVQLLNEILKPVSQSDYYLRNKKLELAIESSPTIKCIDSRSQYVSLGFITNLSIGVFYRKMMTSETCLKTRSKCCVIGSSEAI